MRNEELVRALLEDVQGLEGGADLDAETDPEAFMADNPLSLAGLSTVRMQLTVANLAALNVNLFKSSDADAAALPTGIVDINGSTAVADYKDMIRYLASNPSLVKSLALQSSESQSSGAPILASMSITPTRATQFGLTVSNKLLVQPFQTAADFQAQRIHIPLKVPLDSFSYINFSTPTNNSGATVNFYVSLLVGKRAEARRALRGGGGPVVMRPGGKGPVAIRQR